MSLFAELKRRNVLRVTIAYVIGAWLVLQVADVVLNNITAPGWIFQVLLMLLGLGLPFVVVFSWVYELTPEGVKKESEIDPSESVTTHTAKRLDSVVIVLLVITLGVFIADRLIPKNNADPTTTNTEITADTKNTAPTPISNNDVPVVAVLPLQALSTEDEGLFLAAGLHDDLLTRLARLAAFRVISRTSVMEYANTSKNIRQIGAELGAGFILEGGLQAIGGRVRINAQLIDAATDEHLWAETFNRPLTTANLFDVQAEIAEAIATALHSTLSPQDKNVMSEIPTESLEAYRAYLEALVHWENISRPSIDAMLKHARRAVELDPSFADAWAVLSEGLIRDYWESGAEIDASPNHALRDEAGEALKQAQRLSPDSVRTLLATSTYYYYGFRDYATALSYIDQAQAIAPYNHEVIGGRGYILRRLGRMSEAADAILEAGKANPNSPGYFRETITTLRVADRCDETRGLRAYGLERFPENSDVLETLAWNLLLCDGDTEQSMVLAKQVDITTRQSLYSAVAISIFAEDYEAAINTINAADGEWAQTPSMRLVKANFLAWLHRATEQPARADAALTEATQAAKQLTHVGSTALSEMMLTAAMRGEKTQTLELGRRTMESVPNDAFLRPQFRYVVVQAYALAGLKKQALEQLEIMLGEPGGRGSVFGEAGSGFDPYLDNIRGAEFDRLVGQ